MGVVMTPVLLFYFKLKVPMKVSSNKKYLVSKVASKVPKVEKLQ